MLGSNIFLRSKYSLGCPIASTAPTIGGTTRPGEPRAAAPNPVVAPAKASGFWTKNGGLTNGVTAGATAVPRRPSAGAGAAGKGAVALLMFNKTTQV